MIFAPFVFPRPRQRVDFLWGGYMSRCLRRCKSGKEEKLKAKTRSQSEDVRFPQTKPCCIVPPVALSNGRGFMGLRPKRARTDKRKLVTDTDVDVNVEWVGRVVNDEDMVQIDHQPVSNLDLKIAIANPAVSATANLSNSISINVSKGLPGLPLFFSNSSASTAWAAGVFVVMVMTAVVKSLLESHATSARNVQAATPAAQGFGLHSACDANYVQGVSLRASQASLVPESQVQEITLDTIPEVSAESRANDERGSLCVSQIDDHVGDKEVYVERSTTELVFNDALLLTVAENMLQPVSLALESSEAFSSPSSTDNLDAHSIKNVETHLPDLAAPLDIPMKTGESRQRFATTEMNEHIDPSTDLEQLSTIVAEEAEAGSVSKEHIETPPEYDVLGQYSSSQLRFEDLHASQNHSNPDSSLPPYPMAVVSAADADHHKRRLEASKALQAATPALNIGAGALGILTGANGGLEMVGMAAAVTLIIYELLWAQTREILWQEIRSITDREKLLHFLKARKIVQD